MYNNLYTNLLRFTGRLFGNPSLMNDTIPNDIRTWIYNINKIKLEGKSIYHNMQNYDICIIRTDSFDDINYLLDEILLNNKPVRVIIINNHYFNTMDSKGMYDMLIDMYTYMTSELFTFKNSSLYKVNYYAPFLLTLQTMNSFNISYSTDWMSDKEVCIINSIYNSDYIGIDINDLLNSGSILSHVSEQLDET